MKKSLAILILGVIVSCVGTGNYSYLDEDSIFLFNVGDTLLYKNNYNCDTFIVQKKELYMTYLDKNYFQSLSIDVELADKNSIFDHEKFHITRRAPNHCEVNFAWFHAFNVPSVNNTPMPFQIGDFVVEDVYKIDLNEPDSGVKTFYYCHKYGVVAFTFENNETYFMDEKHFEE